MPSPLGGGAAALASPRKVLYSGWLRKKGRGRKLLGGHRWHRRWFLLSQHDICYLTGPSASSVRGTITLHGAKVTVRAHPKYAYYFSIATGLGHTNVFELQADTAGVLIEWLHQLDTLRTHAGVDILLDMPPEVEAQVMDAAATVPTWALTLAQASSAAAAASAPPGLPHTRSSQRLAAARTLAASDPMLSALATQRTRRRRSAGLEDEEEAEEAEEAEGRDGNAARRHGATTLPAGEDSDDDAAQHVAANAVHSDVVDGSENGEEDDAAGLELEATLHAPTRSVGASAAADSEHEEAAGAHGPDDVQTHTDNSPATPVSTNRSAVVPLSGRRSYSAAAMTARPDAQLANGEEEEAQAQTDARRSAVKHRSESALDVPVSDMTVHMSSVGEDSARAPRVSLYSPSDSDGSSVHTYETSDLNASGGVHNLSTRSKRSRFSSAASMLSPIGPMRVVMEEEEDAAAAAAAAAGGAGAGAPSTAEAHGRAASPASPTATLQRAASDSSVIVHSVAESPSEEERAQMEEGGSDAEGRDVVASNESDADDSLHNHLPLTVSDVSLLSVEDVARGGTPLLLDAVHATAVDAAAPGAAPVTSAGAPRASGARTDGTDAQPQSPGASVTDLDDVDNAVSALSSMSPSLEGDLEAEGGDLLALSPLARPPPPSQQQLQVQASSDSTRNILAAPSAPDALERADSVCPPAAPLAAAQAVSHVPTSPPQPPSAAPPAGATAGAAAVPATVSANAEDDSSALALEATAQTQASHPPLAASPSVTAADAQASSEGRASTSPSLLSLAAGVRRVTFAVQQPTTDDASLCVSEDSSGESTPAAGSQSPIAMQQGGGGGGGGGEAVVTDTEQLPQPQPSSNDAQARASPPRSLAPMAVHTTLAALSPPTRSSSSSNMVAAASSGGASPSAAAASPPLVRAATSPSLTALSGGYASPHGGSTTSFGGDVRKARPQVQVAGSSKPRTASGIPLAPRPPLTSPLGGIRSVGFTAGSPPVSPAPNPVAAGYSTGSAPSNEMSVLRDELRATKDMVASLTSQLTAFMVNTSAAGTLASPTSTKTPTARFFPTQGVRSAAARADGVDAVRGVGAGVSASSAQTRSPTLRPQLAYSTIEGVAVPPSPPTSTASTALLLRAEEGVEAARPGLDVSSSAAVSAAPTPATGVEGGLRTADSAGGSGGGGGGEEEEGSSRNLGSGPPSHGVSSFSLCVSEVSDAGLAEDGGSSSGGAPSRFGAPLELGSPVSTVGVSSPISSTAPAKDVPVPPLVSALQTVHSSSPDSSVQSSPARALQLDLSSGYGYDEEEADAEAPAGAMFPGTLLLSAVGRRSDSVTGVVEEDALPHTPSTTPTAPAPPAAGQEAGGHGSASAHLRGLSLSQLTDTLPRAHRSPSAKATAAQRNRSASRRAGGKAEAQPPPAAVAKPKAAPKPKPAPVMTAHNELASWMASFASSHSALLPAEHAAFAMSAPQTISAPPAPHTAGPSGRSGVGGGVGGGGGGGVPTRASSSSAASLQASGAAVTRTQVVPPHERSSSVPHIANGGAPSAPRPALFTPPSAGGAAAGRSYSMRVSAPLHVPTSLTRTGVQPTRLQQSAALPSGVHVGMAPRAGVYSARAVSAAGRTGAAAPPVPLSQAIRDARALNAPHR